MSLDGANSWATRYGDAMDLFWREGRAKDAAEGLRAIRDLALDEADRGVCLADEALCLGKLGRCDEARRLLTVARKLLPQDREYDSRVAIGEVFLDYAENRFDEVVRRADELLRRYRDILRKPEVRYYYEEMELNRAMALARTGRYQGALPALERALEFGCREAEVCYHIVFCEVHLRRYAEAKRAAARALEDGLKPPWIPYARQLLGLAEWGLGACARAVKEMETAEALAEPGGPLRTRIYKDLAVMWKHLGRDDHASHYERLAAGR